MIVSHHGLSPLSRPLLYVAMLPPSPLFLGVFSRSDGGLEIATLDEEPLNLVPHQFLVLLRGEALPNPGEFSPLFPGPTEVLHIGSAPGPTGDVNHVFWCKREDEAAELEGGRK